MNHADLKTVGNAPDFKPRLEPPSGPVPRG